LRANVTVEVAMNISEGKAGIDHGLHLYYLLFIKVHSIITIFDVTNT